MNPVRKLFVCCITGLFISCRNIPLDEHADPRREFQRAEPAEARKYTVLNRTTFFETEAMYGTMEARIVGILDSLPRRFPQCSGIASFSEDMMEKQGAFRNETLAMLQRLRSAADGGGATYEFEWTDGTVREYGLLAIRAGRITAREVMLKEEVSKNN